MQRMRFSFFIVIVAAFILAGFFAVNGLNITHASAGSISKYAMEKNTNRYGEDYKDFDLPSPDPALCAAACMGEARCKAWTYVKPGVQGDSARCWLKGKVPPPTPDENCVSGVKGKGVIAPPRYVMERNTNRYGEDYKDFDLSSPDPELCAAACMGEARCKAWTYVKPGVQGDSARCWLKGKVPPPTPDENCVSGVKGKGVVAPPRYVMERNTNRYGEDYKDLDLSAPDPALCAEACMGEARCKAWTYVKPGVQGDSARCWLKDKVPPPTPDENCVSGVKKR